MPLNIPALTRRRRLLGMSQHDLAITAGISPTTVQRIESNAVPDAGGKTGIDVLMRLGDALRMDYRDLMIPPTGNRYERAVQFAVNQHSPLAAPKFHDRSRTVLADGYRKLSGLGAARDILPLIEREEADAEPEVDREDSDHGVGGSAAPTVEDGYDWLPDPSTE